MLVVPVLRAGVAGRLQDNVLAVESRDTVGEIPSVPVPGLAGSPGGGGRRWQVLRPQLFDDRAAGVIDDGAARRFPQSVRWRQGRKLHARGKVSERHCKSLPWADGRTEVGLLAGDPVLDAGEKYVEPLSRQPKVLLVTLGSTQPHLLHQILVFAQRLPPAENFADPLTASRGPLGDALNLGLL